ncbi:MAG: hypothetical protein ACK5YK_01775, partial [Pseudomonadota bacterium]
MSFALVLGCISPHTKGMKCFGLAIVGLLLGLAAAPLAQEAPQTPPAVYDPITGLIRTPAAPTTPGFSSAFEAGTGSGLEQQSVQGAGGFGYHDYSG